MRIVNSKLIVQVLRLVLLRENAQRDMELGGLLQRVKCCGWLVSEKDGNWWEMSRRKGQDWAAVKEGRAALSV